MTIEFLNDWRRTDYCGSFRENDVGRNVTVMGWIHRIRDHGGVIFLDLRDRTGMVQVVCNPTYSKKTHQKSELLHNEYVVAAKGKVTLRPEGLENPNLLTGKVEIMADELKILNTSAPLPFALEEETDLADQVRYTYRFLDMRRPGITAHFALRHKALQAVRDYFSRNGFWELETPFLTRSTPEGARDYLVPSRVNPGFFYALPQSPQLFKQLFMVSGFDRYFQVVRCFRDEDLRADRQPEFTQIDIEMSFVDRQDVMQVSENMLVELWNICRGDKLPQPFPRLTYRESMERYGTDAPDLRFGLEMVDCSDLAAAAEFKTFREVVDQGGEVRAVCLPDATGMSRSEIDNMVSFAQDQGAAGMAWVRVKDDGDWQSPLVKFFPDGVRRALLDRLKAGPGALIFFMAGDLNECRRILGMVRTELARRRNLIPAGSWSPVWITDFPLVEYDPEEKRYVAVHHPFTAPMEEDFPLLKTDPLRARARAYDIVLNGQEVGGGSIRIHRKDIQGEIFSLLGIGPEEAEAKFGFLLRALEFGAPPHGGLAFGFDRLMAMLAGVTSIREIIPFPKTQKAICLLTEAPAPVDPAQLKELSLRMVSPPSPKR